MIGLVLHSQVKERRMKDRLNTFQESRPPKIDQNNIVIIFFYVTVIVQL